MRRLNGGEGEKTQAFRLVAIFTIALLGAPLVFEAAGKVPRIGVLMILYSPDADPPQAFRQRLRDLGYVEGQNIVIDWRYVQVKRRA